MALLDTSGNVVAVSPGFRQLFGVPDHLDLAAMNIFDDEASNRQGTLEFFRKAQQGEVVEFHNVEFLSPFGSFTITSGKIFPIRDPENRIRFLAIVHDNDRPKTEAAQRAQRRKLKVLATLFGRGSRRVTDQVSRVHELLELASQAIRDGQRADLPGIIDEALSLTAQVTQVTGSVTGLAEDWPRAKTAVHLGDLVTEVCAEVPRDAIRVTTRTDSQLWACPCDRTQMSSVLSAIVENAVEASQEADSIRVFVQNVQVTDRPDIPDGDYVAIRVEDDGPGIEAEILPHVFDPYFTTKPNAAGLGLTMAKTVVTNHGGSLHIESLPQQGTRVQVLVPADPSLSLVGRPGNGSGEAAGQGPCRILVMDDNPKVRRVLVRMLEAMGYLVDSVADGRDAVRMASTAARLGRQYRLAILDLSVPDGMGGMEALRQIREISSDILAVATSGHAVPEDPARYEDLGFADFIAKPFTMDALERVVRRLTDETRSTTS